MSGDGGGGGDGKLPPVDHDPLNEGAVIETKGFDIIEVNLVTKYFCCTLSTTTYFKLRMLQVRR